ncbi:molybdate ABC transporter substrate-binding protein [Jeongeupia chitinilytica]|uniref:Molybdate ABC transporter substrate-binding protein n=1 Tax=Jeongeupia chitinilytica TaxID=1041641 RepID=A0ABQ3GVI9_9NEIS|nr:molybdate ABC transporter substrate-binding protein [Jeongeupia chitinilytica]GHD57062.1 molybdate ABC transporter substrate-binding protein [Jeongeupia chitinilytica]
MRSLRFLFAGLAFAALSPAWAAPINVAVAANLQYTFDDLARAYKAETGLDVNPSYGASGKFFAQIGNGAPFHVFLSADANYPQKLDAAGLTLEPSKVYAHGALVLWTLKDLDLKQWDKLVREPGIERIAVANPETAPYGRAAVQTLAHFKLTEATHSKLVFGESIGQTNQFISTRAADLGFTAKSVVLSTEMQGKGRWLELPAAAYEPIAQRAALLKYSADHDTADAKRFYQFLFSPKAQDIFKQAGYKLP